MNIEIKRAFLCYDYYINSILVARYYLNTCKYEIIEEKLINNSIRYNCRV